MSLTQRIAALDASSHRQPAPVEASTAGDWFTLAEAFEDLCVRARDRAHAPAARSSPFDQALAEQARFKQLRHGLNAPLRAAELAHLCRIAGVQVPAPAGKPAPLRHLLEQLDTSLLRSMRAGYLKVATREALRTAALIREELEARGEVLS